MVRKKLEESSKKVQKVPQASEEYRMTKINDY